MHVAYIAPVDLFNAAATYSHTHAPRTLCALVLDGVQEPRSPRYASLLRLLLDYARRHYRL